MARKRMMSPSFWSDEKIGECNMMERLLFLGLVSNADDEGIGRGNPKLLKSLIFPYDDLRVSDFEKSLAKLASLSLIQLYQHDGQTYYCVLNFKRHQTINKPSPSDFPSPPPLLREDYGSTTVVLPPNRKEEKRSEEKGSKENILPGAQAAPVPSSVIDLPLNTGSYAVLENDVKEWGELYPAVDVMQELRAMKGWLDANPQRRKTKNGIKRFINAWLSREQDKGAKPKGGPNKSVAPKRSYEFNDFERAAMQANLAMAKKGEGDSG